MQLQGFAATAPPPFHPVVWWGVVGTAAVGVVAVGAPIEANISGVPPLVALAATLLQAASLVFVAIAPRSAIGMHLVGVGVNGIAAMKGGAPWPLSVTGIIALSLLFVALALARRGGLAVIGWVAAVVVLAIVVVLSPERWYDLTQPMVDLIVALSVSALAMLAAIAVASQLSTGEQLESVRRDAALEQERRRAADERARIAREMHDVVAHSMSAVAMRATSAPYRLTGLDEPAREEFAAIAAAARSSLAELRQVLSVLRWSDDDPVMAPQPALADLDELVESARGAGLRVTATTLGRLDAVPEVVQLAAYRVVQEALSNAIRHAPGAEVTVEIAADGEELLVLVLDTGVAAGQTLLAERDGGHGLIGMAERVDALGGRLRVGPEPGGGFRVTARLPYARTAPAGPTAESQEAP